MTPQRKEQIRAALDEYCTNRGSQNAAANSLQGVSSATITQVLRGNWDNISDAMWRNISKQLGIDDVWQVAELHATTRLNMYYGDAQHYANVHAIVQREGGSKSFSAKLYTETHPNAWLISCSEYFNRKTFLSRVLQAMGKDSSGTANDMMERIIRTVHLTDEPLLMLDETDKLNDQVLSFFITFYNELEDKCGIVMMGTDFLQKRIERGVRLNKRGYKEIYSRIGRRFIDLGLTQAEVNEDIISMSRANGIEDAVKLREIVNKCDGDYRRVKKLVHAFKKQAA